MSKKDKNELLLLLKVGDKARYLDKVEVVVESINNSGVYFKAYGYRVFLTFEDLLKSDKIDII